MIVVSDSEATGPATSHNPWRTCITSFWLFKLALHMASSDHAGRTTMIIQISEISETPQTQQCRQNYQTAEQFRQFPPSAIRIH